MEKNRHAMDDIVKKIKEKNQEAGRRLTLEELMTSDLRGKPKENGIDRYILVHITNYQPKHDKIRTVVEKNVKEQKVIQKIGLIEYPKTRDTTHFTVNGKVNTHGSGNWDERKYAVLVPLKDFLMDHNGKIRLRTCRRFLCKRFGNIE